MTPAPLPFELGGRTLAGVIVENLSRPVPCPCCGAWGGAIEQPCEVERDPEGLETVRLHAGVQHSALKGLPRCAWWDHVSGDRAAEVFERGGRLGLVEGAFWRWVQRVRFEAWRRALPAATWESATEAEARGGVRRD